MKVNVGQILLLLCHCLFFLVSQLVKGDEYAQDCKRLEKYVFKKLFILHLQLYYTNNCMYGSLVYMKFHLQCHVFKLLKINSIFVFALHCNLKMCNLSYEH